MLLVPVLCCFLVSNITASFHGTRYFPFLRKPSVCCLPSFSQATILPFFSEATAASMIGKESLGVSELWGFYDLCQVIESLRRRECIAGNAYTNPLSAHLGLDSLIGKSILYRQEGRIRSAGLLLEYEQSLPGDHFSIGLAIPVMGLDSHAIFSLDKKNSDKAVCSLPEPAVDALDAVRRQVHNDIGLCSTDWHAAGFGDLDLHVRWYNKLDHVFLMREINMQASIGVLLPTSKTQDFSIPTSVPFMGNGHWGGFFDATIEAEIQPNWKLGFNFGVSKYFSRKICARIPLACEPIIYAAMQGEVLVDKGRTWKIAPYITLENILDGLDFHVRFSHMRHDSDYWMDLRDGLAKAQNPSTFNRQETLTRWRSSYLTFGFVFDTKEAFKSWPLQPTFSAMYDMPLDTWSCFAAKTNRVTIGVDLHF